MKRIDLHIHTNKSDGMLSPIEVINVAKQNNVQVISITDHDTTEAYTDEVYDYAEKNNIKLIPGVEISTKIGKCGIHILGYNVDVKNAQFISALSKIRNARHDYLHKVSKKLEKLSLIVNEAKLEQIDVVTKAHIANDIISNNLNKKELLKQFGHIPQMGEFIETIMNENCPAYVEKETITPKGAAELIRASGGKVVLAHPVAYIYEDNLTTEEIMAIANEINADGIEAYYIYVDKNNNIINETEKWSKLAKANNMFTTIGSDFHKSDGLHAEIGLNNYEINFEAELI